MKPIICFHEETCVMCGDPVPEGRQVCPRCEAQLHNPKPAIPAPKLHTQIINWFKDHKY